MNRMTVVKIKGREEESRKINRNSTSINSKNNKQQQGNGELQENTGNKNVKQRYQATWKRKGSAN